MASVFTRIIQRELPSFRVYENEHVLAFLARDAIHLGHTLIVPKIEVDYFIDVPEPYYSAVFAAAKPLGRAIHEATSCKRVGVLVAGWDVPHFHCHLIPMFDYEDLEPRRAKPFSPAENTDMQRRIEAEIESGMPRA